MNQDNPNNRRILVTDFDGTLTQRDFYELVAEQLLPSDAPDFWGDLRAGRRTLFETLAAMFAFVPAGEERFLALTRDAGFEPNLKESVERLQAAGWEIVVVSAGCGWYIDHLLHEAGVDLKVFANPGHIDDKGCLIMERPTDHHFLSEETGVSKAAVVRSLQEDGYTVAYAGDGPPDLEAALLVAPNLRFARSDLAERLEQRGEPYRPFKRWREVAMGLAGEE